jgi:signal transduction histidine kinase
MLDDARQSKISKSGEVLWPDQRTFVTLITPIEEGGQVAILHDVTRFKDLDKVKNEFIATASHDLKNPITTIAGFSTLLGQAGSLNEQQKDFVERIQIATQNMSELVQNMISLAQLDLEAAQKHEVVDMGQLIGEIAHEFSPQVVTKGQTLNFSPFPSSTHVNGDALQLKQLFRNLIGNALKYSPAGGTITFTARAEKGNILMNVQDTGYGIPTADLPFIFDRFYRVRNGKTSEIEGNGLGLAIVKSIVEQHGGQISVESEENRGTCFSVSLPLCQQKDM